MTLSTPTESDIATKLNIGKTSAFAETSRVPVTRPAGYPVREKYWPVAQLVERSAVNAFVAGSNPARPAKKEISMESHRWAGVVAIGLVVILVVAALILK